jgi:predicted nucleic acid-binding protein
VIVADTSLIARFVVHNEQSELAEAVCGRDSVWAAPLLWRSEFRNLLVEYVQHAGLGAEAALLAWESAEDLMGGREYGVSSERVLELAVRSGETAFACEYVALAQDLGVPLVTTDERILRAFPKIAVSPERFLRKL